MNEIVKAVVDKNLTNIELYLKLVTENSNRVNLFFLVVYELINGKMLDIDACPVLYLLIKHGMDMTKIKNVSILLLIIRKRGFAKSYKLLLLCLKRQMVVANINKVASTFCETEGTISNQFQKVLAGTDVEKVEIFHKTVKNELFQVVKAFDDRRFIHMLKNSNLLQQCENFDAKYWEYIHEEELRVRLINMVYVFGVPILQNMGVTIMTFTEFNKLPYLKKINYYSKSCVAISTYMVELKTQYATYRNLVEEINSIASVYFDDVIEDSEEDEYDDYDIPFMSDSEENELDCVNIKLIDVTDSEEERIGSEITNVVNNFLKILHK